MRAVALAVLALLIWIPSAVASPRVPLEQMAAREALVQTVGWRLARGNAPYCEDAPPAIGLALLDTAQFAEPDAIRVTLGLSGPVAVLAVAAGSPAAGAGLRSFEAVEMLGELRTADVPASERRDWERATRLHDHIDEVLARDGAVAIDGTVVSGLPACATRWEMRDRSSTLAADGTRVVVGDAFPGLGYPEDEFAAALAHELAHNLLGHRARLDAAGRKTRAIRETEREADRLSLWLLANAGYDPAAAPRFMRHFGPRHPSAGIGGWFRKRTHDGWDERAEAMDAELAPVRAAIARHGVADWRRDFEQADR